MQVLKLTCAIVMIAGCFRPLSWTSLFKRTVYNIYRLYVISMLFFFSMAQFLDIILNADNADDMTDTLNMLLTSSAACYKVFIMWFNYERVSILINCLTKEPFAPMDPGEMEIRQQFDKMIRNNTLRYTLLIETTCSFIASTSLLTDFRHRRLTYREWVPYDYSSFLTFCFTYAQQMSTTFHTATVNVACDTLLCGFLMHVCCQIAILEHRLNKLTRNEITLSYCVRHHDWIYEFARLVNTRFTYIIGFQFMASMMVICSNLYQLTKSPLNADSIPLVMYTSCMLTQIFIYCWFGNKVKVKSIQLTDKMFEINWPILNNNAKKGLLIMMKRSTIPIEICTAHIITLNLESFVGLIKTSYSACNLLTIVCIFSLIKKDLKMHVLNLTFFIVTFVGCFRPLSWTSLFKRAVYNLYRLFIIIILYTFAFLQFMDIVLNVDNPDDFTNNLYMMLNVSVSGYKLLIMWINYTNIATLIKKLNEEPFKPLDTGELEIRQKFDKLIRLNTLRYTILIETSWSCSGLTSLLVDFRSRRLTYREWVPYDYSSYIVFCITYAHQFLSTFYCATVNVACDTLICGLLMHVCCQIEILEYRIKNLINKQDTLSYCVHHHNSIFQFANLVNTRFSQIIGFQFITSTLIICSNLFQLSKSSMSADNIALIIYTCCMLTQIFIYCWFGNKVKVKSIQLADSVFQADWPMLNNNIKKELLIIMQRAIVPIEFTTAHIISLNLDSFVALLKTSYSAYNLLVRVQEE
ncbi:uncharacterized protein [Anoplolepis gracilipes]|uniref:uncharacterized protein n=1 Tax=Anoplolepis gracilipes TaxID=354296 RepID=UPI003BA3C762